MQYFYAYLISFILFNLSSLLVSNLSFLFYVNNKHNFLFYLIVPLLNYLMAIFIFTGTYSIFKTLNLKKASVHIFRFGLLGLLFSISYTYFFLKVVQGKFFYIYVFSSVLGFTFFIISCRFLFKRFLPNRFLY